MPATPITNPVSGESLVGTEPQLSQQVDPGWRHRLNLFTGRALSDTALDSEQLYRGGLLATSGLSVTAGIVNGLALTMDASGADPVLSVSPGYGIAANGQDVVLNSPLKTTLSTLAVVDAVTGNTVVDAATANNLSFRQFATTPNNKTYAGILILQPVVAQVSGQSLDTGTGPIEVSGNLGASCDQDPEEYAFEDWQIADALRLVFLPWPTGVAALPLPALNPEATWRNRVAYAIFEAEALLGPDDQLPWSLLGVPVALIGFDPGVAWQPNQKFTAGQFLTDANGNVQVVQTTGTSGATQPATWNTVYGGTTTDGGIIWVNSGLGWKPLFVDCSAVVRAGGLPRRRYVLPSQPPPALQWQSNTLRSVGAFILDPNDNVQMVQTAGTTGGPPPKFNVVLGQTTTDGSVVWINKGPGSWQPNTAFVAGQFLYDSNGNIQTAQAAGTSGSTEPAWNGIYLPTLDGTITWVNNGSGNPPVIQAGLAQARINQLSEQLSQAMTQQAPFTTLADIFPTLPPSGILPAASLNFATRKAPWFPPNWSISAAPVYLEELETVLETGMLEALLAAETSAPADQTLLEPVEVLIPLPDSVYDSDILVTETVAPGFQQELDQATQDRDLTLQRLETVQQELNTLFAVLGPNVPANPNLIDPDAGLTPQELQGRDTLPPYMPAPTETFGTVLPTTWTPSTAYAALGLSLGNHFVIDGNGAIQVVTGPGTSGATAPLWNTTIAGTTTDGTVAWLNNGPWMWQPNTAYIPNQFVVDSNGFIQVVTAGGASASSPPNWGESLGQNTLDRIIWLAAGNPAWQPDNQYSVGQLILDSTGNVQMVQTGGISGDSAPAWNPTPGQTTQDSGVTWNNLGNSPWQKNTLFAAGQVILDSNQKIQIALIGGISGAQAPTWNEGSIPPVEEAITWSDNGPLAWQPGTGYAAGQIVGAGSGLLASNSNLQFAQTGGTSGNAQPAWSTSSTPDGTVTWVPLAFTGDAAVAWANLGPLTWLPERPYLANQIILDANGNLQLVQTAGTSLNTAPAWNTTPGGTTTDGQVTWVHLAFYSTDLVQLTTVANQPPYTITFTDGAMPPATHKISLLSADDLNDLANNGLPHFITRLNARISQANDLLDTSFLTAQTDIYRYRQNILGTTAATTLATSTVLANIATGETATATAANLQDYLNTVQPPATTSTTTSGTSSATSTTAPAAPVFTKPVFTAAHGSVAPVTATLSSASGTPAASALALRSRAVAVKVADPLAATTAINLAAATGPSALTLSLATLAGAQLVSPAPRITGIETVATQNLLALSPTQVVFPGQTVPATPTDITGQSPLPGAQLNLRTLTVAERLQQSPSQEALYYSIANRLNFLQALATLENDLGLVADDLPILVDGQATPPTSYSTGPPPVPVIPHTFSEWLGETNQPPQAGIGTFQPSLQVAIQSPYLVTDPAEATMFSVGVRVVEQQSMLLRALEARVQQYVDFVSLCTTALNNIQSDIQQAQVYVTQLQNNLHQDRQNVAFTAALLSDETQRVQGVNAQRLQILQSSVQLVAYTRARTLQATDTTPSRQLVPANVANPVPACLQQSVSIPPELREIVSLLREAPVSWLPSAASQVSKLERPVLLQQLALSTQARAAQQLQTALLPSSAAGEPGVYAPAISTVYSSNQQTVRTLQVQRATFQPAAIANLSWSLQVATVQNVAAVNDLFSSDAVHAEVTNAVSRLIQQISSVATCLYTRAGIALPIDRLAWAEYLSGAGASAQLQSLAILPNWNQLAYTDRQQMQLLVDWLFQQINTAYSAATAFMSDVVRTAILLASDVPVDNIIPANIIVRTQPTVGGVVSLNLPSDRVGSGMFVNLYSGANLAARAVVSDLDASTVSATVTDVFKPGVYLETSDVAHLTTQTPQALALRPLFNQS